MVFEQIIQGTQTAPEQYSAMARHSPFDYLPIETTQQIASFIEYDQDICSFQLACRSTRDAVDADNGSFWRKRFIHVFEDPSWKQSENWRYKVTYQSRKYLLKNNGVFETEETGREIRCLGMLKDLILETFGRQVDSEEDGVSRNLEQLQRFMRAGDFLQIIFKPRSIDKRSARPTRLTRSTRHGKSKKSGDVPVPMPIARIEDVPRLAALLKTIQIVCAPMLLSFEPHLEKWILGFPQSQAVVYSTPTQWPIFTGSYGLDVNMDFVLHNINFWRYHMIQEFEHTLFQAFSELESDERPRWWTSNSSKSTTPKLGRHWKGSYAYIEREDMASMREGRGDTLQIQDRFGGEDSACAFQELELELVDGIGPDFPWPPAFEDILHSLTPRSVPIVKTRAQMRSSAPDAIPNPIAQSFRFDGEGYDVTEQFLASGWLNALPPQNEIPGWQRMTMMKYFEDDSDPAGIDVSALWAYEGVVLPGGQIMLGRWWSPGDDEMYSGPFMLWCVDGPKYENCDEDAESNAE